MTSPADGTAVRLLGELLGPGLPAILADQRVPDIHLDSRHVTPGALFLAVPGAHSHGLQHAAAAAAAGAAFVAWEPANGLGAPRLPEGCRAIPVPGLRVRLGTLADRFFGEPTARFDVVGITGTNGKTTCAHLVASALDRLGRRAGSIGTLGVGPVGLLRPSRYTTPDVVEVHRQLAGLADCGVQVVAMEVSSHALDQGRVDGVRFAVAAFTNLSHDHLDYHLSLEAYGACKARLFLEHGARAHVINAMNPFGRLLAERLPEEAQRLVITATPEETPPAENVLRLAAVESQPGGLVLTLAGAFGTVELRSPLVGHFNAENLAVAFGVLLMLAVSPVEAARALSDLPAPAGRMEAFFGARRDVLVVVDYAHTPDALQKALEAIRPHCRGRVWCVFGCGGERDRGKRPEMGRIAEALSDEVVVTDDNPRGEDAVAIVTDILAGLRDPAKARVERDRAAAIQGALAAARPGDVVLVAGKGHEEVQIVGAECRPFSDRQLAAAWMRAVA